MRHLFKLPYVFIIFFVLASCGTSSPSTTTQSSSNSTSNTSNPSQPPSTESPFSSTTQVAPSTSTSETIPYVDCSLLTFSLVNDQNEYEICGFEDCATDITILNIPEVYNGKAIVSIGYSAFQDCLSLREIILPKSIKKMSSYSFCNCLNLASVTLQEGLEYIGEKSFFGCNKITSISIPSTLNYLGDESLPDSISYFASYSGGSYIGNKINPYVALIKYNSSNNQPAIHSDCKIIYYRAFIECDSNSIVTLPESLVCLGSEIFNGSKLRITNLPNLKYVGRTVMKGRNWEDAIYNGVITVDQGLTYVGTSSNPYLCLEGYGGYHTSLEVLNISNRCIFWDGIEAVKVRLISIPKNDIVKKQLYFRTPSLETIMIGSQVERICITSNSITNCPIPNGTEALEMHCPNLISLNIPNSVKKINLEDCTSLTSIVIPEGTVELENFSRCSLISNIIIPNSVKYIGSFAKCTSLTRLILSKNVISVRDCSFFSNKEKICNLYSGGYYLPSADNQFFALLDGTNCSSIHAQCEVIADKALYKNSQISSISLPSNTKRICDYSFASMPNLTYFLAAPNLLSVGSGAFSGCSKLASLIFPNTLQKIGSSAFINCICLEAITLPANNFFCSIEINCFFNCQSLSSINIPFGITSIGDYAFCNCQSLSSINIPSGITSIGNSVFENCRSLSSINIPFGITSIGNSAFYYCKSLSSINISRTVSFIGERAFADCQSLLNKTVFIPINVSRIEERAFDSPFDAIRCEAKAKPSGWHTAWYGSDAKYVVWGCAN